MQQQFLRNCAGLPLSRYGNIFVKESDDITDVFDVMRSRRIHLAIVMNDMKEHSGIVTLEDIIEEVVGELEDEYFKKKYPKNASK